MTNCAYTVTRWSHGTWRFPRSLVNKPPWHESFHQATSRQQEHDDQSKGSCHLVPKPRPGNHGTHYPRNEDLRSQPTIPRTSGEDPTFPRISGDDPRSQTLRRQPHIHLHERSSALFSTKEWEASLFYK